MMVYCQVGALHIGHGEDNMAYDYDEIQSIIANDRPIVASLSAGSAALALVAIASMSDRWRWPGISDAEWNILEAQKACLDRELMVSALVATVQIFFTETLPAWGLLCDGTTYNKVDYPDLYAALHPAFIKSGSQFTVPDLRDKFLLSDDTQSPFSVGGEHSVQLTQDEMPRHRHTDTRYSFNIDVEGAGAPDPLAVGLPIQPFTYTSYAGGDRPHENRPRFYVVRYCIVAR